MLPTANMTAPAETPEALWVSLVEDRMNRMQRDLDGVHKKLKQARQEIGVLKRQQELQRALHLGCHGDYTIFSDGCKFTLTYCGDGEEIRETKSIHRQAHVCDPMPPSNISVVEPSGACAGHGNPTGSMPKTCLTVTSMRGSWSLVARQTSGGMTNITRKPSSLMLSSERAVMQSPSGTCCPHCQMPFQTAASGRSGSSSGVSFCLNMQMR